MHFTDNFHQVLVCNKISIMQDEPISTPTPQKPHHNPESAASRTKYTSLNKQTMEQLDELLQNADISKQFQNVLFIQHAPYIKGLLLDHVEIIKYRQIMDFQVGSQNFNNISFANEIKDQIRVCYLSKLLQLQKQKKFILNDTVAQQRALKNTKLLQENSKLKQKILNLQAQLNQKTKINSTSELKFYQTINQLRKSFIHQTELRNKQFKQELAELFRLKSQVTTRSNICQQLGVTMDDFKSLIMKLANQNKMLKQEKDLLLAKLTDLMQSMTGIIEVNQQLEQQHQQWEVFQHQDSDWWKQAKNQATSNRQLLIAEFKQELDRLENEIYKKNVVIQEMNDELHQLKMQKGIKKQISKTQLESSREPIQRTNADRFRSTILKKDSTISDLNQLRKKDNEMIENLRTQISQLTKKIQENKIKQTADFKLKIAQLQQKLISKDKQLQIAQIQLQKLKINSKNQNFDKKKQQQIEVGENTIDGDSKSLLSEQISKLRQQIDQQRSKKQALEIEVQSLKKQLYLRDKIPGFVQLNSFFVGNILDQKPQEKQFLRQILQKSISKPLKKTKLLWQADPNNKTNLHQYVDNHDYIVFLIEMQNGSLIAAYSQSKLYPKMKSEKDGLIISINNRQVFELMEANKKAVSYDDMYVIFGNSELRIRSGNNMLYSNFGILNSFYKNRGMKAGVLLGQNVKEASMKYIQAHQLIFY